MQHPMIVHLPIALAVVMPIVALGLLAAWWRGTFPRRTWLIAIVLQAMLVGTGFAALRTGEADGERVERVVSESLIEAHEEAAEAFLYGGTAVLLLVLAAGLIRHERTARSIAALAVAGTLVVLGLGYRAGKAGGELVYRHGAAATFTTNTTGGGGGRRAPVTTDRDD